MEAWSNVFSLKDPGAKMEAWPNYFSLTKPNSEIVLNHQKTPHIYIKNSGKEMTISAEEIKSGKISLDSNGVYEAGYGNTADIPVYKVGAMYDHIDVFQATIQHCRQYPQRLFMIRDHGRARHLMMCVPSPRTEYTYWTVATGFHDWGQGDLEQQKP